MPGQILDIEGDYKELRHVPTTPTVTVKVPKGSLKRFLNGQTPYVLPPDAGPYDEGCEEPYQRRVHLGSRWLQDWDQTARQGEWDAIQQDRPLDPAAQPGTSLTLQSWYRDRNIQFADYSNYRMLGKVPHLDTPDGVRPMLQAGLLNYQQMQAPFYQDSSVGVPLYRIDSGWFEGMDTYYFNYGEDAPKHMRMEDPSFPFRYRLASLFTAVLSNTVCVNSRFRWGNDERNPDVPLLRFEGLIGFAGGNYAYIEDVTLSCFWDKRDIGFRINLQTGEVIDLGDPAEESFEAEVNLRWGNWFIPSNRDYSRRSGAVTTLLPGMRFTDLFNDFASRAVAEIILADTLDWDDRVSCDQPIPFGAVAGWRRIKRCSPGNYTYNRVEYESTTTPLIMGSTSNIGDLVQTLRASYGIGSVIRQNGLALTTTSEAVKSEDHHLLEMVSKGTTVPQGRRRWYREPEHKRVYTVENAEAFKSYLVEGQEENSERLSVIPGKTQWDFLMGLGKVLEGFNTWRKEAQKEDQKLIKKYERTNPTEKLPWAPYSAFFNVKVEVA